MKKAIQVNYIVFGLIIMAAISISIYTGVEASKLKNMMAQEMLNEISYRRLIIVEMVFEAGLNNSEEVTKLRNSFVSIMLEGDSPLPDELEEYFRLGADLTEQFVLASDEQQRAIIYSKLMEITGELQELNTYLAFLATGDEDVFYRGSNASLVIGESEEFKYLFDKNSLKYRKLNEYFKSYNTELRNFIAKNKL
jgi:hypothetical protein